MLLQIIKQFILKVCWIPSGLRVHGEWHGPCPKSKLCNLKCACFFTHHNFKNSSGPFRRVHSSLEINWHVWVFMKEHPLYKRKIKRKNKCIHTLTIHSENGFVYLLLSSSNLCDIQVALDSRYHQHVVLTLGGENQINSRKSIDWKEDLRGHEDCARPRSGPYRLSGHTWEWGKILHDDRRNHHKRIL